MTSIESKRHYDDYVAKQKVNESFDGEFEVQTFFLNGKEIPPDKLFTRRWKSFLINERAASIQSTDGASINWLCHVNLGHTKLMLISPDLSTVGNFSIEENDKVVTIDGIFYLDTLKVVAHRKSSNPYPLLDRGFHWVNEFPLNR